MVRIKSAWTYLLLELNALRDVGVDLTFEEVVPALEGGDVFGLLQERYGDLVDLGILKDDRNEMEGFLSDLWSAQGGSGLRRKFGIELSGLGLITALAIEAVQLQLKA